MASIELAGLAGSGKSTLRKLVIDRARAEGLTLSRPDPRVVRLARASAPLRSPAYSAVRRRAVLDECRALAGGGFGDPPTEPLVRDFMSRSKRLRTRDAQVRASRDLPHVLLDEAMVHSLVGLLQLRGGASDPRLARLVRGSAICSHVVHLEVGPELARERILGKSHDLGRMNSVLSSVGASSELWSTAIETYDAVMCEVARRPDVTVLRITTKDAQQTAQAAEQVWQLLVAR